MSRSTDIVASKELFRLDEYGDQVLVTVLERAVAWKPESWGIMLFDLVHHLSTAYAEASGKDYEAVAADILRAFDLERHDPMRQEPVALPPKEYH